MGKTIFITEKPLVAQEYRKVLQVTGGGKTNGYIEGHSARLNTDVIITWAVGHLIGICPPGKQNEAWDDSHWKAENLPMIPRDFKYSPLAPTYDQFKVVKSLYTRDDIDCIYYAGDSGREGIYIQALIRNQIFKNKTPKITEKVIWIDSYTEESILNGIKTAKPYSDYQNMIDSGYMRAISDWLIGMNFTQCFTLTNGSGVINVGRVMTPTLAMVVNRQNEIDNFTKTPYFGIKADDFASWKAVKGTRYFENDALYNDNGFLKREDAQKLIDEFNTSKQLTVENVKVQAKTEYAPYLFNLADLQAMCSRRLHISPAETLKVAQKLYEDKCTTYPRTDSRFLTNAVAADLKKQHGYDIPKRYIDDSKVTDHYALIPTFQGDVSKLTGLEKTVYEIIMKRFTDILLPPYLYDSVSVTYMHKNGEKFFEGFRIDKQLGFKEKADKEENEQRDDVEKSLNKPVPKTGDVVPVTQFTINEMETKPPTAYTTGSLILAMEKAGKLIEDEELREQIKTSGIGTSATRANIIEKLEAKKFITIDKKQKIAPTEASKAIIPIIGKFDEALISPVKTAEMENKLSALASGEMTVEAYRTEVEEYVRATTKKVLTENKEHVAIGNSKGGKGGSSNVYNCPCCGSLVKYGKFGWYCTNKPACQFSLSLEICGYKTKEKDLTDIIKKGKTGVCTFKSKAGKPFKAHLVLDKNTQKCNFEFADDKKK